MLIGLFFSYVLIVALTHGVEKGERTINMLPGNVISNKNNITKIAFASEGGAIMSNTPVQSFLPENNPAILIPTDSGSGKSKVKARKGAEDSENIVNQNILTNDDKLQIKNDNVLNVTNNTNVLSNLNQSNPQMNRAKATKPPIVSVEAIAKADQMNSDPAVDDVDERNVKIHTMNSNGHPGMVMPIIITILVVPMFAVIGYMALKRGREAWKNRHYKRMDFLLDGMYND